MIIPKGKSKMNNNSRESGTDYSDSDEKSCSYCGELASTLITNSIIEDVDGEDNGDGVTICLPESLEKWLTNKKLEFKKPSKCRCSIQKCPAYQSFLNLIIFHLHFPL